MKKRIVLVGIVDFDKEKAYLESELPMFLYGTEFVEHEGDFCMFVDDDRKTVSVAIDFLKRMGNRYYIDESYSIRTMSQVAKYINYNRAWEATIAEAIERNGWKDEMNDCYGVCTDGCERVVLDEYNRAMVISADALPWQRLLEAIVEQGSDPTRIESEEDAKDWAETINGSNVRKITDADELAEMKPMLDLASAKVECIYAFCDGRCSGHICLDNDYTFNYEKRN